MAIRKAERARVFAMFDGKCAYCKHPLQAMVMVAA